MLLTLMWFSINALDMDVPSYSDDLIHWRAHTSHSKVWLQESINSKGTVQSLLLGYRLCTY